MQATRCNQAQSQSNRRCHLGNRPAQAHEPEPARQGARGSGLPLWDGGCRGAVAGTMEEDLDRSRGQHDRARARQRLVALGAAASRASCRVPLRRDARSGSAARALRRWRGFRALPRRLVVYVGEAPGGGGTQLWRHGLETLEAVALPGTEGAAAPAVSPDGRAVSPLTCDPHALAPERSACHGRCHRRRARLGAPTG
jgi:hypothetical protein